MPDSGGFHVLDTDLRWQEAVPWVRSGNGWVRGAAVWRHNGTEWVRGWRRATEAPRAPQITLNRVGASQVRPIVTLRGPYDAKIIRVIVQIRVGSWPGSGTPRPTDGPYYSTPDSNGYPWSEWWYSRSQRGDIMQGQTQLSGGKASAWPLPSVNVATQGRTVYARAWIQDEFKQWSSPGSASVAIPRPVTPPAPPPSSPSKPTPVTRTQTWSMSWFRSYGGNRSNYDWATSRGRAIQGQSPAGAGRTRSLIGFPNIRSQIGDISRIRVYVHMTHWYYHSGGTLVVGVSDHSSAPSRWVEGRHSVATMRYTSRNQGRWITIPSSQHSRFKAGNFRAISLYAASNSLSYYGYADASRTRIEIRHRR